VTLIILSPVAPGRLRAYLGPAGSSGLMPGCLPECAEDFEHGSLEMSKEDQTLTLIKASYATPIRIAGSAADRP
jgi:hypothetical protein